MANIVADLKADLGFRIDYKKLREFERRLKDTHRRLNSAGERVTKDIRRNTKTQLGGLVAVEKRLNKHRGQLWQLRNDYWRTNQEFKKGNISHERRNRLLTEMHTRYSTLKRESIAANRAMAATPMGRAKQAYDSRRGVTGGSRSGGVRTGAAAGAGAAGGVVAGGAAIGAAAVGAGAFMSNEQYQRFEGIKSGLVALEGSASAANKRLQELAQMAQYYGQPFMAVGEGFKSLANNLKGTAIEDQTMKIFNSLQAYATAMGLNQQDLSGIQLAVGQIAAAGKLQGDEINQLAERGVSREKLAAAMGLSLEEFMKKQGTQDGILAKDLLPALARVLMEQARTGGALEQRRSSTQAEQNRALNNAVFANILTNMSGLNFYFQEFYKGLQKFVENALPLFEQIGKMFASLAGPTKKNIEAFGELLGSIGNVAKSLNGIDIESPFVSFSESLKKTSAFLEDISDTIDLLRSDNGWKAKVAGVSTMLVNQLERIAEYFINTAINTLNTVLPKAMEVDNFSFEKGRINNTKVDLSGVNALIGNINTELNKVAKTKVDSVVLPSNHPMEVSKRIQEQLKKVDPETVNQRLQYPPNHPLATSQQTNNNTVHQTNNTTINIDGSKQPDEILGTIEDHINGIFRTASVSQEITEK
ncbi:MAG: tape measure protein [Pseudomonadota bacterium]